MKENYYFTFGSNHLDANGNSLGNKYVKLVAENEGAARERMVNHRGPAWCTSYPEKTFLPLNEKFPLTEVSLESANILVQVVDPTKPQYQNTLPDGIKNAIRTLKEFCVENQLSIHTVHYECYEFVPEGGGHIATYGKGFETEEKHCAQIAEYLLKQKRLKEIKETLENEKEKLKEQNKYLTDELEAVKEKIQNPPLTLTAKKEEGIPF